MFSIFHVEYAGCRIPEYRIREFSTRRYQADQEDFASEIPKILGSQFPKDDSSNIHQLNREPFKVTDSSESAGLSRLRQ